MESRLALLLCPKETACSVLVNSSGYTTPSSDPYADPGIFLRRILKQSSGYLYSF
nr:MAG TPA: hypothetical protein [Caudoviricetes sp.]